MWDAHESPLGLLCNLPEHQTRLGILKGRLFQEILERYLPLQNIHECVVPFGTTCYDVIGCQTKVINKETKDISLATAIRASATFPVLFSPVFIDGKHHIDGT